MRRLRITTTVLLLITLQVAGMASATMMGCPQQMNGQRQASHPEVVVTTAAMAHQHCRQHQDQHRQRSGCESGCTCLGPCAGGLAAVSYTQYTTDADLSHHWSASSLTLASLAKPLNPFRPPITSAT